MIRVVFGGSAPAELRITTSPLWEVFGSLSSLVLGRAATWPYSEWGRAAERALMGRPGLHLVAWFRQLRGPLPELLTPIPAEADQELDEQLEVLLGRLSEQRWRETPELSAGSGAWSVSSRRAWGAWFSHSVLDYWQVALRPSWGDMRAALREEVLTQAHVLATQGAGNALSNLGSRVRWTPQGIELPGGWPSAELTCTKRLTVVPLIFGRRMTRCLSDGEGGVALSYPARGSAVLSRSRRVVQRDRPAAPRADRMAMLLGRGRAAVLRRLVVPTTTSELAESLGMSASTVSQHLSTLLAAEVVRKRRSGVRVMYSLDATGAALLMCLADDLDSRDPDAA